MALSPHMFKNTRVWSAGPYLIELIVQSESLEVLIKSCGQDKVLPILECIWFLRFSGLTAYDTIE